MEPFICPDPGCRQRFAWKGGMLAHLEDAHEIVSSPSYDWTAVSPAEFQHDIDAWWDNRPRPEAP